MNEKVNAYRSQEMQLTAALVLATTNKAICLFPDNCSIVVVEYEEGYTVNQIENNVLIDEIWVDEFNDIDGVIQKCIGDSTMMFHFVSAQEHVWNPL